MAEAKSRSSGVAWETVFEDVPVVKHSGCLLEVSRQKLVLMKMGKGLCHFARFWSFIILVTTHLAFTVRGYPVRINSKYLRIIVATGSSNLSQGNL